VWAQSAVRHGTGSETAYQLVSLSDSATSVAMRTTQGVAISGTVVFEGGAPEASPDVRVAAVAMELPPGAFSPVLQSAVSVGGEFTIEGVFGPRIIRVEGLPPDWFVAAVQSDGRDVTDHPTDFASQATPLTVRLKRGAQLAGVLTDDGGRTATTGVAVVFSTDPARWGHRSRFVKAAAVQHDGTFVVHGLPVGEYRVAAVASLPQGWEAPEVLRALEAGAVTVDVREGRRSDVTLKTKGGR
jgi:hypothetical protein